jgi:hypothetical protein
MADSPRGNLSLENTKPNTQKRRHARPRSRPRRLQSEQRSSRCSSPRRWSSVLMPIQMTALSSSTRSLSAPTELTQGITMERTPSGNSIISDAPYGEHSPYDNTLSDQEAAQRVENHFRPSDRKHERILRGLIKQDKGDVDDETLGLILRNADLVFFGGVLSGRVSWEWSSHDRYQTDTIGTTALRRCIDRPGYETLIVLSHPILHSNKYDRRLLLSAFLHELVHCYLFIMCGFKARDQGGHTEGFKRIVNSIDDWLGPDHLHLYNFKANLDYFVNPRRDDRQRIPAPVYPRFEVQQSHRNVANRYDKCCENSPPPVGFMFGECLRSRYI